MLPFKWSNVAFVTTYFLLIITLAITISNPFIFNYHHKTPFLFIAMALYTPGVIGLWQRKTKWMLVFIAINIFGAILYTCYGVYHLGKENGSFREDYRKFWTQKERNVTDWELNLNDRLAWPWVFAAIGLSIMLYANAVVFFKAFMEIKEEQNTEQTQPEVTALQTN